MSTIPGAVGAAPVGGGSSSIAVDKNGVLVGTRGNLNFIEGTNVTLTIADDAGNGEVDITINASGGSGSVGPMGPPGLDGEDGADGQPGSDGAAGATGATGSTGPAGAQGPPGLDGLDGEDGANGPPGPAGGVGFFPRRVVGATFDGNGSTPTVGTVGYAVVPFSGTIDQWHIVANASGSAVVDVWKAAGAIPVNANSIAGTEKPTLVAAQLGSDVALGTWTTTVTAGDVFGFELESVATCTRVTVEVRITESA